MTERLQATLQGVAFGVYYKKPTRYLWEGCALNNKKGSDIGEWILIIFMLMIFWPVGVFLLFRKLMGYSKSSNSSKSSTASGYNSQYEYHYSGAELKNGQKKTAPGKQPSSAAQTDLKRGKGMTIGGGIMAALFGITGISKFLDHLSWGGLSYAWSELFMLFGLCVAGLVIMYAGLSRTRKGKRFQKYLNTIGRQKKISAATLARPPATRCVRSVTIWMRCWKKGSSPWAIWIGPAPR